MRNIAYVSMIKAKNGEKCEITCSAIRSNGNRKSKRSKLDIKCPDNKHFWPTVLINGRLYATLCDIHLSSVCGVMYCS